MADINTVRTIRIRGVDEGLDTLRGKLQSVAQAQDGVAKSSDAMAVATERAGRRQLSAQAAWDRQVRQLDATARAQEQYARVMRDLDRARAQGIGTEQRHAELLALAAQRFGQVSAGATAFTANFHKASAGNDNFARSTGLARHELINFGRQLSDLGTMAAMGSSPFQIIASQAGQLADIFTTTQGSMRGVLSQFAGGIGRFATSGLGLAAGAGAAGIWGATAASGYIDGQREIERALHGVGAASGVTLAAINRLADGQAAAAKVSVASAREMAAAYANSGRVNPAQLPGLLDFTRQFGAMQGLGNGEAAQELAKAFADPSKGAEALADKLGGLNSAAQRWIRDQQAAGNMLGAQASLLEAFRVQVEGSTDRLGFFARAWDGVKRAVSDTDDAIGRFLAGSNTAQQQLEALRAQRDRFAALPTRTQRAQDHVAGLDAEIRKLEAIVELDRQRAAIEERVARAANASRAASAIADRMDPFATTARELQADRTRLEEAMRLNPRAGDYEAWAKSLERVNGAIATMLPNSERERQLAELNIRAIGARTFAERAAIEVAREALRLSGEKVSAAEREIAMQRKAAEMAAQASRDAQDALRASRDQLALAGKNPADRFRIEQEQRLRDNRERFGDVNTAMPATTAAANGLDAAFAESLRKLMAAVPGLGITSGYRSYEDQARLYRDKPGWAAHPDRSNHPKGTAADLNYNGSGQLPRWVRDRGAEFGIHFPLANRARNPEPWHAEPIGGRGRAPANDNSSAAAEIYRNAFAARELEAVEAVNGDANRELQKQAQLLGMQREAWGASTAEVAKAAKAQELANAFQREGISLGPGLMQQINTTAEAYGRLAQQQEDLRRTQEAWRTVGDLGRDFFRGVYDDARNGVRGVELFTRQLDRVASKLMDMALNDLFGKAFGNSGQGLFGGGGFLSSLFGGFGGGGGSVLGLTPGSGGLYADGGYVRGPGGPRSDSINAWLSNGEFVVNAAATSRYRSHLEAMNSHRYADGGYVHNGAAPYVHPQAANDAASRVSVQIINESGAQVQGEAKQVQRPDGSLDLMVRLVEARIADGVARGQGSLSPVLRAVGTNRQLQG